MRDRLVVSPRGYRWVADVALGLNALIVLTGAAVRLTGSGLGCPDWPRCHGRALPPLDSHTLIEFGNRMVSLPVTVAALAALVLAFRRRPYRRDLVRLAALLPVGVLAQAVLGGLTVILDLAWQLVVIHFLLSMAILAAAAALAWRARHAPGERPRTADRVTAYGARTLLALGGIAVALGTLATAAGPHAGGAGTGDYVQRLQLHGPDTMTWMILRHGHVGTALGLASLAFAAVAWRRRGVDPLVRRLSLVLCGLLGAQGVVGLTQYYSGLPTELVWLHILLASLIWLTLLWMTAAAGALLPRTAPAPEPERERRPAPAAAR